MAGWVLSALLCAVVSGGSDCTIVHFTADWCEPCKQIEPALQQLRQEGWTIQTVDVDRQPELVQQFRIENLPTLAILCRDQEVDRMVGAAAYERILERVQRAAARNQSGGLRPQAVANQAAHDPSHAEAGEHSDGTTHAQAAAPVAQAIVRGQSPEHGGFPMLASNARGGNRAAGAMQPQAASSNRTQPNSNLNDAPAITEAIPTQQRPATSPQSAASNPTLSVEQAIARAAAATVRIRVDEGNSTACGTGTIVDVRGQEALILTCGHLFRDMQPHSQLTIDLFPGTPQEVNLPSELIDFKAEGEDIGLISFRIPLHIEPVPILGRGQNVAVGQPAFSFGCDRGANPTRRDTQIKSINRYLGADNIEIVGAPVVGRSGGGLFDIQGRLIGVCNAANAADDEGIYASADVVYTQIERLGLSELFEGDQPSAGPNATASLASATVAAPTQGWQGTGAQSATAPQVVLPAVASAEPTANSALQWPDQSASVPSLSASQSTFAAAQSSAGAGEERPSNASNTRQVICIIRDAGGEDKVVTIDAPPEQLLQIIEQQTQLQGQRR